ncbi:MAG: 50S ribosomal protein L21 [Candidatus Margulisiibacteriota bacterium]
MTYAIIESGNKQYKIEKGSVIDVELLGVEKDAKVNLDRVLLVADEGKVHIGTPYLKDAKVNCSVIDGEIKDVKVVIFKYKSKSNYHKKTGHRQRYSRLLVEDIAVK